MLKGVLLIFSACFVWGLFFVIPEFMVGFSPLEVALGCYFFLGISSCLLWLIKGFRNGQKFSWSIWRQATIYALLINIVYYFSLVTGLRYSSSAVVTLIVGMSPITITFYSNWRKKEISYRHLLIPSLLIGSGLICVNWPAFTSLPIDSIWKYGFGLLCGLLSLVIWNWYMVANARFLKENPTVSSSDWSTLIGIGTFFWVIMIGLSFLLFAPSQDLQKYTAWESSLISFLLGGLILGIVCSWLGSYLWNRGSQVLPISLAGQLAIFETVFGLIFLFLVKQRLPELIEFIGIIAILSGVGLTMLHFHKPLSRNPSPLLS